MVILGVQGDDNPRFWLLVEDQLAYVILGVRAPACPVIFEAGGIAVARTDLDFPLCLVTNILRLAIRKLQPIPARLEAAAAEHGGLRYSGSDRRE